jgi:hypothetical protein
MAAQPSAPAQPGWLTQVINAAGNAAGTALNPLGILGSAATSAAASGANAFNQALNGQTPQAKAIQDATAKVVAGFQGQPDLATPAAIGGGVRNFANALGEGFSGLFAPAAQAVDSLAHGGAAFAAGAGGVPASVASAPAWGVPSDTTTPAANVAAAPRLSAAQQALAASGVDPRLAALTPDQRSAQEINPTEAKAAQFIDNNPGLKGPYAGLVLEKLMQTYAPHQFRPQSGFSQNAAKAGDLLQQKAQYDLLYPGGKGATAAQQAAYRVNNALIEGLIKSSGGAASGLAVAEDAAQPQDGSGAP